MMEDKIKQYIALFGGWLAAVLLFLGTLNIKFEWFNVDSINAFVVVLSASAPLILAGFGVWKNTYVVTKQAKNQEEVLKDKGLK